MKFRNQFLILTTALLFLISCSKDDEAPEGFAAGYANGILISHEGSSVSGSVSFVSADLSIAQQDIYHKVNQEQLGTFQQSIGFTATDAYIIVDNANTIAVVDRFTFENKATLTEGLETPRFMTFYNGKGYVSNWGDAGNAADDFVAVIDLETHTVIDQIAVAEGPEQLLSYGDKIYVSHKGGLNTNHVISVIDTTTNTLVALEVGDNPDQMFLDGFDNLWVLCHGKIVYDDAFNVIEETAGAIMKIDTNTNTVLKTFAFSGVEHPGYIGFDNGRVYYSLGNSIYAIDPATETFPGKEVITVNATYFYGMALKDGKIFTLDAGDFVSSGSLDVYDISSKTWSTSISLGVGPSKVYFN